ncbi:MAG: chaperonin [Candidatus Handelsmanbacteria bacterium RIFCSPLOWO2_12_FULL_64_10]|uniref:Chaperonin n=1 Tax=Handelsmanbacteria sp. (strain RIFCSPLOWO2_12_FULL_64_10) TaxID=1817868 RepID=A0A1F6CAJ7_HANXR|nr:MAG: chaperonin [Candidatus Handelsmanbacteria bacterium RIFCSPLOWO2_12_FULL_64_10]
MSELIIVGDRVLIEPEEGEQRTEAGLFLPATVTEKEKVGAGRVVRVGPGYLMANPEYSEGEPWTQPREVVRYLPLQAQPGDLAFFLRKEAVEITYEKKSYVIVHHAVILALVRPKPEDLLENIEGLLNTEE